MPAEFPDKKPFPETDSLETGEPVMPNHLKEDEEQDLDDLVHNNLPGEIPFNEEIDADDVVHNSTNTSSSEQDTERDPDDLVHGN